MDDRAFSILGDSKIWSIDGTFKGCVKGFY